MTVKCTFFSNIHGTYTKINHILGHKTNLNKFNKMEIIQCSVFSDHSGLKLEITNRKITANSPDIWKLSSTLTMSSGPADGRGINKGI